MAVNAAGDHLQQSHLPEPARLFIGRRPAQPYAPAPGTSRAAQRRPEHANTTVEIVISHVESLIERTAGIERATPDADGDYPVRYADVVYYVRVVGGVDRPIVRVFSPVISDLEASPDLFEELNYINSRLNFCRCFFANDRVMIETEHLGMTIRSDDFRMLAEHVATASAIFGEMLTDKFGGTLEVEARDQDSIEADPALGLYL